MTEPGLVVLFPAMLDLRGRSVLVVGGGRIAARKAAALVESGAEVTCVAPVIGDEVRALGVRTLERGYRPGEVAHGYWLVFVATDDPTVQRQVYDDGVAHRVWVNAADDPSNCSFILPAVHRDGPVVVAVSTSGAAPALASWLRSRLAGAVPANIAGIAEELAERRAAVRRDGRSTEDIDWVPIIEAMVEAPVKW